jgi:serine/threonine protein kinase
MGAHQLKAASIFDAAVELANPAERAAYLDAVCGQDAHLRAEVEELLKHDDAAGSFLNRPIRPDPKATTDERSFSEGPGTMIGSYKVLEQIGEGGFGVVFLAEQTQPVRRKVALKVLKPGMDTRQVIARFEAERQALAIMDHPNIARVFDGGATASGRPYFVMELVKGVPITEFCDQNKLTTRQRLELFVPLCQAVQHAHQKGIIHRDLKPSNVLVSVHDTTPVIKVIDFGVAKALGQELTDKTLFTGFAQMIGTPLYMSPEQAGQSGLDIDTRSDIYSLGVLLYELLTGTTPFTRERLGEVGFDELRRIIREEEPPRPSTRISTLGQAASTLSAQRQSDPKKLTRLLRGELDWVVMKCLEKDRNRRYETANGLATDVQRYLADEAVQACPPSPWYRLRKMIRRNKGPVIMASAVLVCLVAGIISTSAGMVWAVRERDDKANALLAEIREREGKEKALAAEKQARSRAMAALRVMTEEIVEKQMASDTHLTEENKEFLRTIITHFEGFAAITADDTESRAIRAEGSFRVGNMRYRLGEMKEAEAAYKDALALMGQLADDFPTRPEFRRDLARSHVTLGLLFQVTSRLKLAEASCAAARTLLMQLTTDFPTQPEHRWELATCQNNRGNLLGETGRLTEAEAAYADSAALFRQRPDEFPRRPELRFYLARSLHNLGLLLYKMDRQKEAQTAHATAHALLKQLVADFSTRPVFRQQLAGSHNFMGGLYQRTGQSKKAEAAYAAAITLQKQLVAEFPVRPEYRQDLAVSQYGLGILYRGTGRLKEAEAAYTAAITLLKQLVTDFPTRHEFRGDLARSRHLLGRLLHTTGELKEAEAAYVDALALQKGLAAELPARADFRQELAESHNDLGNLYQTTARPKEAEAAHWAALALRKQLTAEFPLRSEFRFELSVSHHNLGLQFQTTGRPKEAEAAYAEAILLKKQLVMEFPARAQFRRELASSQNNLGYLLQSTGRPREAEAIYADALALFKQLVAELPNQPDVRNFCAATYGNLARLQMVKGDFKAAKAHLAQAAPHHEAALEANPRNPIYQRSYLKFLAALMRTRAGLGDPSDAKSVAEKMRDIGWHQSGNAYDAACDLSSCIPVVQKYAPGTRQERDKQALFYSDEAMKMLQDAVNRGWKDVEHMKQERDLEPLRGREDFKKLLADLEMKTKK